jgi:hypothetical protein
MQVSIALVFDKYLKIFEIIQIYTPKNEILVIKNKVKFNY